MKLGIKVIAIHKDSTLSDEVKSMRSANAVTRLMKIAVCQYCDMTD